MTLHSLRDLLLCWLLLFALIPASAQPSSDADSEENNAGHRHSAPAAKAATADQSQPSTADALDPETRILTIQHRCAGPNSPASARCTTTVSKKEFDLLVKALDPNMSAFGRQSLATEYSRLLMMASELRARRTQHTLETEALLKFSALQVLAAQLIREISASKPQITDLQVEQYFNKHIDDFRQIIFRQLRVPAGRAPAASTAESMRLRAAKGENFQELARELGMATADQASSNTRLGPIPCRSLPHGHRQVCSLKPGEVSPPLALGQDYFIYRVESVTLRKLEEIRGEIRTELEKQHVHEAIRSVRTPVALEFDQRYFGKLPDGNVAAEHGLDPPAATTVNRGDSHPAHHHR